MASGLEGDYIRLSSLGLRFRVFRVWGGSGLWNLYRGSMLTNMQKFGFSLLEDSWVRRSGSGNCRSKDIPSNPNEIICAAPASGGKRPLKHLP